MFWIKVQRIIKSAWANFRRNGLVSSAAILVTTITLSVITGVLLFQAVLSSAISEVKNKVDIAVYFTVDAPEEKILVLQEELQKLPEVASVDYVSADEQVLAFRDRHVDDYLTLQALDELGDNPFGGNLRIMAQDPTQYEAIARVLEGDSDMARDNASIIERINYSQNKVIIERLNSLVFNAERIGLIVSIVLAVISIIVMYTTIRLTIYSSREEIGIMRLVGASRWYVRAPFLIEGMLYGIFAWLLTQAIFLTITYGVGPKLAAILGLNLFQYYLEHAFFIAGGVFVVGMILGVISSMFAVRRYLNV